MEGPSWGFHSRSMLKAFCGGGAGKTRMFGPILTCLTLKTAASQTHLVLLAPSLLIIVEDVVADVVLRLANKQPRSFPDAVAPPTGGHSHSQQQQHCEEERHASVRLFLISSRG